MASLLVLVAPVSTPAQVETTTRVSGIVTDPTGSVVPMASVTAKNEDTGGIRNTATDASGYYSIVSLLPGKYTITVSKQGFKTALVTGQVLLVATPAKMDVTLELGTTSQSVTVSAAGAELVSTTTAEISGTISPNFIQEVPVARRSFMDMLVMTPATVPQNFYYHLSLGSENLNAVRTGGGGSTGDFTASGVFVAGSLDQGANISVDGTNVQSRLQSNMTQFQSLASVQEVRVESGNMNAEFGYGVAAVNVVTKSGTNSLHGEAFEFLRNNHLDAAPYFTNLLGQKLPNFQQNQFGGAVGGPIKRDKLMFFGNYEGMRVRETSTQFETVPPIGVFNGDFTDPQFPTIYNPFQVNPATGLRQPFPGNKIPIGPTSLCAPRPQCADSATLAYLQKWVVHPNTTLNGIPTLVGNAQTALNSDQYTVRIDFLESSRHTIYGRWTYENATQESNGIQPLEGTHNPYGSQNAVIHWTAVLRPTLVNDLMLGYTRPSWAWERNTLHGNVAKEIGLQNTGSLPGGPIISVPGFSLDQSESYVDRIVEQNYQFKDDLSYVHGRHSLKFGTEINERRMYFDQTDSDLGQLSYGATFSAACPAGNAACDAARVAGSFATGGAALADYLLGTQGEGLVSLLPKYNAYQRYYGFYAQDSWRATSKLTVNAGIRYERWKPWLIPNNITAQWDGVNGTLKYALQNPLDFLSTSKCLGECAPLNPGVPREGYKTGNLDFAPRVGMAFQLTPKTVLRAAGGIMFDGNDDTLQISQLQSSVPPFGQRADVIATADQALPGTFTNGLFPLGSTGSLPQPNSDPPASFRPITPYMQTAAVYQWSGSVQKALSSYWSLEVDYLGSHTIHEHLFVDLNSARLPQGQYANLTLQQRRIFPQWGRIGSWIPVGWAKYDALIVSLKNRQWHNLSLISNFTWAKGLTAMDPAHSSHGLPNIFGPPDALAGNAAWVPQKSLVLGYNYTLPFGRGKAYASTVGPVVDKVVGGWTFSGISWFSTGSPQPIYASTDFTGTALARIYPNRICNPNDGPKTRLQWFNTSCFANAPFGTWPNSPIGSVTFPGVNNWDLSIAKNTSTGFPSEKARVEFRLDLFNAFNHTQWGDVRSTFGSGTFGQILDTRPARKIQFGLRFVF